MLKIRVSSLKPGVRLGKDIYSYDSQLLLPRGTVITLDILDMLRSRGLDEVFIMETSRRLKSEENFAEVYSNSLDVVKTFMTEAKLGKPLDVDEISQTTEILFQQVFDKNDLFRQMRLMKDKDDYLFTHSVNVSLLCILIGRWLKCDEETIKVLGMAGLVHDIGKVFIPIDILNKPDKLTDEEYAKIKKHTVLGYELLRETTGISADIASSALMHHERADGSGYPLGSQGYSNFYASVVAVADIYDAITSTRSYSIKSSPYTAAEILWQESFGRLDPRISKVFYDKITNFYIGNEVMLSNGEKGIVVFVDPSQPTRPMVMVEDRFYNLATDRSITILEVVD